MKTFSIGDAAFLIDKLKFIYLSILASKRLPCIGRRGFVLQNLDSPEKGQSFRVSSINEALT